MTTTNLAAALLRDVPRYDAYDVMMTLDGHPLPGGCAFGKWVRHTDVLAALTAALDGVDERAGAVLSRLRPYAWAYSVSREAADLITALLAQNAALAASEARVAKLVEEIKRLTEVIDSTADYLEENHQSQGKPYRWLRAATTEASK